MILISDGSVLRSLSRLKMLIKRLRTFLYSANESFKVSTCSSRAAILSLCWGISATFRSSPERRVQRLRPPTAEPPPASSTCSFSSFSTLLKAYGVMGGRLRGRGLAVFGNVPDQPEGTLIVDEPISHAFQGDRSSDCSRSEA
jgi:hypothetical protein